MLKQYKRLREAYDIFTNLMSIMQRCFIQSTLPYTGPFPSNYIPSSDSTLCASFHPISRGTRERISLTRSMYDTQAWFPHSVLDPQSIWSVSEMQCSNWCPLLPVVWHVMSFTVIIGPWSTRLQGFVFRPYFAEFDCPSCGSFCSRYNGKTEISINVDLACS